MTMIYLYLTKMNDNLITFEDNDSDECVICAEKLKDDPFAQIDDAGESKGKYHTECLEKWFMSSNDVEGQCIGVITREPVTSYSIYHNESVVTQISCKKQVDESINDPFDESINDPLDESMNDSFDESMAVQVHSYSSNYGTNTCVLLCVIIIIILFFLMADKYIM